MSKLVFNKDEIYKVGNHVTFTWLGDTQHGFIEKINTNDKGYPVYYVRSNITGNLYNCGAELGVTVTGVISGLYTKPKTVKVVIDEPTVTEPKRDESIIVSSKKQPKLINKEKSKKPVKVTDFFEV
jgi:hypothetical protein